MKSRPAWDLSGLSRAELKEMKRLAQKAKASAPSVGWRYIDPADYIGNWHIDAIAEHLEAVANGQMPAADHHDAAAAHEVAERQRRLSAMGMGAAKRSPLTGPGVGFLSTSYAQTFRVRDNVKSAA
jgi:hypothetical protein